jgi:outer membrane protein assembly complex protein YaeT
VEPKDKLLNIRQLPGAGRALGVIISFCLVCLLSGGAAEAAPPESSPWRIGKVSIEGADNLDSASILEVMENKPAAFFSLAQAPEFSYAALERDRNSIIDLYKIHGYFQARVRLRPSYDQEKRLVDIAVRVRENHRFQIKEVELVLEGPEAEIWRRLLLEEMSLKPDQPMSMEDYLSSKEAVIEYLGNHAHPLARVESQVLAYSDTQEAVPRFLVDPGSEIEFGEFIIVGEPGVKDFFIQERLLFTPGQAFSHEALRLSQELLTRSRIFSSVLLTPLFERLEGNRVPIAVEARPARPHTLALGLGYGTEENFRMQISQVNRNLLGLGDVLVVSGKYSSLYLGFNGDLSLPLYSRHLFLETKGGIEESDNESFNQRSLYISPALTLSPDEHTHYSLGIKSWLAQTRDIEVEVPDLSYELESHLINSVFFSFVHDARDSALAPSRGWMAQLEGEAASLALLSDVSFIKARAAFSQIIPLGWDKWALAWDIKYAIIMPLENTGRIPLAARFFPGGSQSVRGYRYQSLGPLDGSGKPLGGEAMLELSLELRFPLWGDLGGVLFMDAGNAYEHYDDYSQGLRFTAGAGLRYNTPLGPVRLDFGYLLNRPDNYGYADYQFYLSVGQAF